MKIVINRCFGGYGLSREALRQLVGKCEHVVVNEPIDYYGGSGKFAEAHPGHDWKKEWQDDLAHEQRYRSVLQRLYTAEGKPVSDDHRSGDRTCPALVEIVERMGVAANGQHAKLAIVEIPDGVEYEIDEYDGSESIHEVHRSWS